MPVSDLLACVLSTDTVVRCRGVGVEYRTAAGAAPALSDVDATFERSHLSVIAGPSGSGKSTLLRVLAGLLRPQTGTVEVDGVELTSLRAGALRRRRRHTMGFVLQDPADNLVEYLRAVEQVELAAKLRGVDPAEAQTLLDAVGLADRSDSHTAQLSGGEQQRVAFAAAAIGQPTLLLADEPTAELDGTAGTALVAAMRRLVDGGATLIVSSHDSAVIAAGDHVLQLRDGEVVSG